MNLFSIVLGPLACLFTLGCYILGVRHGFKMGRMTVDKPAAPAKKYNPGQPALAEDDPWEQATQLPKEGTNAEVMETMK